MIIIPDYFARFMVEIAGDEGRVWLEHLPTRLASYEHRWHMTIGSPMPNLTFNYVASAVLAGGTEAMVKTGLTDEFPSQPEALRHFAGHGMVRLLAYDEQENIMLMERLKPGLSLRTMRDDEAAISIAVQVMRQLWRPLPQQHYPFPTIHDWGQGFARLRKLYNGGTGPIPTAMFEKGERLFEEMSASSRGDVLLHGDLHQDNILSAERESWLAVDPKGVIGEPAYETGALLRNFWPDILNVTNPTSLITRRIDRLSSELGFERERIYNRGFAQAVLSVIWNVEDGRELEDEGLYFVELLNAIS